MKTLLRNKLFAFTLIIFGTIFQPSLNAQILGRGFGGAMSGAVLGSLVGGRNGAQKGAMIGGAIGLIEGSVEKSNNESKREARERQQAEREKIERDRYQAELNNQKKQEATQDNIDTGTVMEIQKSLMRLNYDPGNINGQMQPATENAIRLYEQKYKLLETGKPSQELLKHMLRNGG